MRTLLSTVFMALGVTYAGAAELPQGVEVARENTYSLCMVLEVSAVFREETSQEVQTDKGVSCTGAFQVSATEVLTSAHVTSTPKDALLERFAREAARFSRHNIIFTRAVPAGDMDVAFYYELYSSDGAHYTTPMQKFSAPWGGQDPTHVAVQGLARYLETVEVVEDSSSATAHLVAVEPAVDLALFRLDRSFERDAYIDVTLGEYAINDEVWGFAVHPPGMFSDGLPAIHANRGVIKGVHKPPNIAEVALDPALWVYRALTDHINPPGVSGNAVVDSEARLVGITMASTADEHKMSGFDVVPPCNVPLPNGFVFLCIRTLVPGHVAFDFLERHRAQ